ncbi:MAG TPA: M1 family metallopeptidase [Phnomibacter sp.]|nr:M1 family metallopeptidase [Phnomibacter sp.]
MRKPIYLLLLMMVIGNWAMSQNLPATTPKFTKADSLRGTLNANRTWWDVLRYDLEVEPDFATETIQGKTSIRIKSNGGKRMQLDLQQPLIVDSVILEGESLAFTRTDNIFLIDFTAKPWSEPLKKGEFVLQVYYHGKPRKAKRAPWDGGWIWTKDAQNRPWMSVACQNLGASVWYPCKDHQSDEPDQGASLTMLVPDSLVAIGNGKLVGKINIDKKTAWRWEVRNPINNYNIIPYIGKYVNFSETFKGEDGDLACNYWVLDYDLQKAKDQFTQVKPMLQCFESWFGPYPFYEDGYKLVEAPHLGMEHQSAVAYGNKFLNGYLGRDMSGTGWGSKWDFIIIHESGHEWFGNNITTKDIADMWVHEGFTNYSETIYTECQFGKQAGQEYIQGVRRGIRNDIPIIGHYGVNQEGSGDMYPKAANMIHTIRTIMQNDSVFKKMLRNMNSNFYHKTVTTKEIETFVSKYAGFDCTPIFDQYLRTVSVPVLEWKLEKGNLMARFNNCNKAFYMQVYMPQQKGKGIWKKVQTNSWTTVATQLNAADITNQWNRNLYIVYTEMAATN